MACQLTDCQDDFCETHGDYCARCKRLRGVRCMCEYDDAIRAHDRERIAAWLKSVAAKIRGSGYGCPDFGQSIDMVADKIRSGEASK